MSIKKKVFFVGHSKYFFWPEGSTAVLPKTKKRTKNVRQTKNDRSFVQAYCLVQIVKTLICIVCLVIWERKATNFERKKRKCYETSFEPVSNQFLPDFVLPQIVLTFHRCLEGFVCLLELFMIVSGRQKILIFINFFMNFSFYQDTVQK